MKLDNSILVWNGWGGKEKNYKRQNYKDGSHEYFAQFSEVNIRNLITIAQLMRAELEIAPIGDFGFYNMNFRLPDELTGKEEVILNYLVMVGIRFGFWDTDTRYRPNSKTGSSNAFSRIRYNGELQISITDPENFYVFYEELNKFRPGIIYDIHSGSGVINGKAFTLTTEVGQKIFSELYTNINKSVARLKILILTGRYEEGGRLDSEFKTRDTYLINDLAKDLRRNTGLNRKQLVNKGGNLTLLGHKKG